jgi:hypothetical protein
MKASALISHSWDGQSKATEPNSLQYVKHADPILWRDDGSRIEDNIEHIAKSPNQKSVTQTQIQQKIEQGVCQNQKHESFSQMLE